MHTLDCFCLPLVTPPAIAIKHPNGADPVWKAIQSEAVEHGETEPLLAPTLQRQLLKPVGLIPSLGRVVGDRLFGEGDDAITTLLVDATQAEPDIERQIRSDLKFIRGQDPATVSFLNPFLHFKGFHAVVVHRVGHWLWHENRRLLASRLQSRTSEVLGVDIHPAAKLGSGVFIDHATGVVIGETAVVGNNVSILHGVTLGGTGKTTGNRHPKVGNGVLVGAHAQLLGNITIGDHAKIGAGSVVVNSVEPYETVIGVAAKVKVQRPELEVHR